jgi:MFS family permease
MVDFAFFRSRSFFGANLVAFIVSYAMLAMFFFIALYMQNVRGYSPLEAGLLFLPSTVMIIILGPLAGRASDRVGPRLLMVAGLTLAGGALFWQSFLEVDSGLAFIIPSFVLMGIGMGLTMSPMSTAAMNAVEVTKAGVASGILSMSRMVGGTFGVASLGALIAALGRDRIDHLLPAVPDATRERIADSLGAGGATGDAPANVAAAANEAFVHALQSGLRIGAAVAFVGAAVAFWLIAPAARRPAAETRAVPVEV